MVSLTDLDQTLVLRYLNPVSLKFLDPNARNWLCGQYTERLKLYFNRSLSSLTDKSEFVLLWDFNVNFIDTKMNNDKAKKRKLLKVTNSHHLDQQINTPTRITEKSSALNYWPIVYQHFTSRYWQRHHLITSERPLFNLLRDQIRCSQGTWENHWIPVIQTLLKAGPRNIDWDQALNKEDIDSAVDSWNKLFANVADSHAPIRKSRIRGVHSPCMNAKRSTSVKSHDFNKL